MYIGVEAGDACVTNVKEPREIRAAHKRSSEWVMLSLWRTVTAVGGADVEFFEPTFAVRAGDGTTLEGDGKWPSRIVARRACSIWTVMAQRASVESQLRLSRRDLILATLALGAGGCGAAASSVDANARDFGNFRAVYGSAEQRTAFRDFLQNVFHLYPEREFDALIAEIARAGGSDGSVYAAIEARLSEVTPFLGAFRYSLPALAKQKTEMANQTEQLLSGVGTVEGYLEIGSHGRYLDELEERVEVRGPIFTTAPLPPSYGPIDVVDRGQLGLVGQVLPWNDYAGFDGVGIEAGSLDLVTIYIGLHHATEPQRIPYLQSLRSLLSDRGRVVIRDHDVTNDAMRAMVGLAHDVFNVGTHETWATNEAERRNFYSLEYLAGLFASQGFRATPARLRQAGDPTLNTLMCFERA